MSENKTAEEFIREKIREKQEIKGRMDALWKYQVSGEDCLRWSHEYANQQNQELQRQVDVLNFDLGAITLELLDAKARVETKDLIIKDFESLRKLLQSDCIKLNKQIEYWKDLKKQEEERSCKYADSTSAYTKAYDKLRSKYTQLKEDANEMAKQIILYDEADGSITIESLLQSAINYKQTTNNP